MALLGEPTTILYYGKQHAKYTTVFGINPDCCERSPRLPAGSTLMKVKHLLAP
jgi:hypothetical protein